MTRRLVGLLGLVLSAVPAAAFGQAAAAPVDTVALSLDAAVQRAMGQSEEVRLARAEVDLARAQVTSARAAALPQLSANLGYTRTLASQFNTGQTFSLPDSLRFDPNPNAPLEQRVTYLEQKVPNAAFGALGGLFGNLPFGQENAYSATLAGSQLLYSGGKVGAALDIARHYRSAAELGMTEQTADVELQVRKAYYQALLAQQMRQNASEALAQAERFLSQEQLRLTAGRASELEVMRAQVSRDNLRPQLVEAENAASLALLNLKRLVDLPLTQPLHLTTELAPPGPAGAAESEAAFAAARRASVQAAQEQVAIREQQVKIARGSFLPSVSLQMNYGKLAFPGQVLDFSGDWRTDWTAGLVVSVPLFQGGKRAADVRQARVQLEQSRLQLSQLEEAVELQYEQARAERERARVSIAAQQSTAQVAQRVYDLTVLRYEQGLATQLDVSDARLSLLQARTNLARAITDFYTADADVARALVGTGTAAPALVPAAAGAADGAAQR